MSSFGRMTELGRAEIGSDLVAQEQGNILDALYERSFEGLPSGVRIFVEDRLLTASGFRGTVPLAEAEREEDRPCGNLETLVDRRLLRFEERLGARHVELSHDLLTPIVREKPQPSGWQRPNGPLGCNARRSSGPNCAIPACRPSAARGGFYAAPGRGNFISYLFGWVVPHAGMYSWQFFEKAWGG